MAGTWQVSTVLNWSWIKHSYVLRVCRFLFNLVWSFFDFWFFSPDFFLCTGCFLLVECPAPLLACSFHPHLLVHMEMEEWTYLPEHLSAPWLHFVLNYGVHAFPGLSRLLFWQLCLSDRSICFMYKLYTDHVVPQHLLRPLLGSHNVFSSLCYRLSAILHFDGYTWTQLFRSIGCFLPYVIDYLLYYILMAHLNSIRTIGELCVFPNYNDMPISAKAFELPCILIFISP